jgi:hypothetical protein
MSSGEADGMRAMRSLDAWRFCRVDGCSWRISNGEVCQEHGGRPLGAVRSDEFGESSDTYADPGLRAAWRYSEIVE